MWLALFSTSRLRRAPLLLLLKPSKHSRLDQTSLLKFVRTASLLRRHQRCCSSPTDELRVSILSFLVSAPPLSPLSSARSLASYLTQYSILLRVVSLIIFGSNKMLANKSEIGLTWCPKISFTQNESKNNASTSKMQESVWKPETQLVDGLFVPPRDPRKVNKLMRKNVKDTTGKSWFDMPAPTITPQLKADLEILRLRSVIDPKQHFKKAAEKSKDLPKYFQVGTVVEPASEFFSGRLTKKERKPTLADELLSNPEFKAYKKRKIREINESRRPRDVEKWKIKGRQTMKRAKQRREH